MTEHKHEHHEPHHEHAHHKRTIADALRDAIKRLPTPEQQEHAREVLRAAGVLGKEG